MKFIVRAIFLGGLLMLSANAAYPCFCLHGSHRKEIRRAGAVFVGQAIQVTEDKSYIPLQLNIRSSSAAQKIMNSVKRYLVRFKVERKFKGVEGEEATLYAFQSDDSCSGYMFKEGERYLIYASRQKDKLIAGGLCSRTQPFDEKSKDYRQLNSRWFRFTTRVPFLS